MASSLREASLPRFALRREEAAASLGISPTTFDTWVRSGRMPQPQRVDGVVLWDTEDVREHWYAIKNGTVAANPLDKMVV